MVVMVENESEQSVVINQGQAVCQIVGSNLQDDYSLVAEVSGDAPLESEASKANSPHEISESGKPPDDMEIGLVMCINKLVDEMVRDAQEDPRSEQMRPLSLKLTTQRSITS